MKSEGRLADLHVCTDHKVKFYDRKEELYPLLNNYISEGLYNGEAIVIIADAETCAKIYEFHGQKLSFLHAVRVEKILLYDSSFMLAMFMRNDLPDRALFERAMNQLLSKVTDSKGIRAYGDMVNVLCKKGNYDAAIELELLWNELMKKHEFQLLCGYANQYVVDRGHEIVHSIVSAHSTVLE